MTWDPPPARTTGYKVKSDDDWSKVVDALAHLEEVAYFEFTVNVSVTGTSFVQVVSAGAITYENVPHLIQFSCPHIQVGGSGGLALSLRDGTTDVGRLLAPSTSEIVRSVDVSRRLTPTAGSHTYNFAAKNLASQTSTVGAGAGGADTNMPGFIRITRVPV